MIKLLPPPRTPRQRRVAAVIKRLNQLVPRIAGLRCWTAAELRHVELDQAVGALAGKPAAPLNDWTARSYEFNPTPRGEHTRYFLYERHLLSHRLTFQVGTDSAAAVGTILYRLAHETAVRAACSWKHLYLAACSELLGEQIDAHGLDAYTAGTKALRESGLCEPRVRAVVPRPAPDAAEAAARAQAKRLATTRAALARWQRKAKLAATKIKKLTARLRRLERAAAAQDTPTPAEDN